MSSDNIDTSFLTPKTRQFLKALPVIQDWDKVDLHQMRNAPRVAISPEIPRPRVNIQKIEIPASNDGHLIHVDIYRPEEIPADTVLPALVYL